MKRAAAHATPAVKRPRTRQSSYTSAVHAILTGEEAALQALAVDADTLARAFGSALADAGCDTAKVERALTVYNRVVQGTLPSTPASLLALVQCANRNPRAFPWAQYMHALRRDARERNDTTTVQRVFGRATNPTLLHALVRAFPAALRPFILSKVLELQGSVAEGEVDAAHVRALLRKGEWAAAVQPALADVMETGATPPQVLLRALTPDGIANFLKRVVFKAQQGFNTEQVRALVDELARRPQYEQGRDYALVRVLANLMRPASARYHELVDAVTREVQHSLLTPDRFYAVLEGALGASDEAAVGVVLRAAPAGQAVTRERRFRQLVQRWPLLSAAAAAVWPPSRIRTVGQRILKRKQRERASKLAYRWEDLCSGKVAASPEELFEYAVGVAAVLDDMKGLGTPEAQLRADLAEQFAAAPAPKRAMCLHIMDVVDEYRALVAGKQCAPLIGGDEPADVPIGQLVTYMDGEQEYCFTPADVEGLSRNHVTGAPKDPDNPYTRKPLPEGVVQRARRYAANTAWVTTLPEEEDVQEERALTDRLWQLLNTGYSIDPSRFYELPAADVEALHQALQAAAPAYTRDDAFNAPLSGADPHMSLVRMLLNFLGDGHDADFGTKVTVANYLMGEAVAPSSVPVHASPE
jgi:hypothetical protein